MKYLGLSLNDRNNKIIKVRIVNTDTNSGKSNGYRMIYYAVKENKEIYLLSIYYKKEQRRILTKSQIVELVNKYCL